MSETLVHYIETLARDLGGVRDLDPLMERIGDARYVLLGEASHGTSDYYAWRARLTQRLIREKNFSFVAVEGDWPDCYRLNRYIKGYEDAGDNAYEVLHNFQRWPTWLWANWEVVALTEWLHAYNANRPRPDRVGFYGLDVYSLWESLQAILEYLQEHEPAALAQARQAYLCFEPYRDNAQSYAWDTALVPTSCEDEVVELLTAVRRDVRHFLDDPEELFNAEQNAEVLVNAERYYRTMLRGGPASWNIRDTHMTDTLDRLTEYHGADAKAIVWEHNTHVGDARATDMVDAGMVNVGQLVRERHGDEVVLVGIGSHHGDVIAGDEWGAPMQQMSVPPARASSWEDILHRAGRDDMLLLSDELADNASTIAPRGHRAIGVVYHPGREQFSNYVPTVLPKRYDAFLFIDETTSLHPMHLQPQETAPPETYPWGV